jgi:sterol 3beta-glucosyltransferase
MSTIAIVAGGTRGDVQPYVALGRGLTGAGHRVRLLASENFEALAQGAGLDFGSTGKSVEERLQSEAWQRTLASGNFLVILRKMQSEMALEAGALATQMAGMFDGVDLVVAGMAGYGGSFTLAEHRKIPIVKAFVFPFTPTHAFPSPLTPTLPLGRALNRLSYVATRQLFWQTMKSGDSAMRRILALPRESLRGPFARLDRSAGPTLYGFSTHVLPRPADWGAGQHVTGYWFLHETGWQPPTQLAEFLESGPPPVYIGFGSMRGGDAEEAGRIALEALARTGQRGLLAAGWGGLKAGEAGPHVLQVGSAPHTWLFPRMAAVVHHGGAGTTAASLRAGVPSVIVPFTGDQPFWGKRVLELGVGPAPIPRKQLSADRLAAAISATLTQGAMRERASHLGDAVRAEDGVAAAVGIITGFLRGAPA